LQGKCQSHKTYALQTIYCDKQIPGMIITLAFKL